MRGAHGNPAKLAELTRQELSAVLQAHAIVLVMATDGGAIQGEPGVDPASDEADKAGCGLTTGRFRGTVGLLSEGTYDM